jgi:hypothetical protein
MWNTYFRYIAIASVIFCVLNVIALDYWFIRTKTRLDQMSVATERQPAPEAVAEVSCASSCLTHIREATASLQLAYFPYGNAISPTPYVSGNSVSPVKEFYIPLGTGMSAAADWTDVVGVEGYIDTTQYAPLKTVVFETTLRIPTGNQTAWGRLYNVTDKHPVWFSDVAIVGGGAQLVTSVPITLDSGNKLYRVQIKTQLQSPTYVDQARIHITTR